MPMAFRWIAYLVTLVIFPFLLYHTVESPMIALGRRWAARTNPMPNYVATPNLTLPRNSWSVVIRTSHFSFPIDDFCHRVFLNSPLDGSIRYVLSSSL